MVGEYARPMKMQFLVSLYIYIYNKFRISQPLKNKKKTKNKMNHFKCKIKQL